MLAWHDIIAKIANIKYVYNNLINTRNLYIQKIVIRPMYKKRLKTDILIGLIEKFIKSKI